MLRDRIKRIQGRKATKLRQTLYVSLYSFGVDMPSDEDRKVKRFFAITIQSGKTSLFSMQSRSFKGNGKLEFSPAYRLAPRD